MAEFGKEEQRAPDAVNDIGKKGKSRSWLILSFAALLIIAVVIVAAVTVMLKRRAETSAAAEQQYQLGEALLKESRQKQIEAEVGLSSNFIDKETKIVVGGKEIPIVFSADTRVSEALLKESQRKRDEAETALREAIRLDPNHAPAYFELGGILDAQNKYAEAEAAYKEA
jgi:cytochrome c-type biogenesis protein CcmH/NrfG